MGQVSSFLPHFTWKQMGAASPHTRCVQRTQFMSIYVYKAHKRKAGKSLPVLCPKEADVSLSQWLCGKAAVQFTKQKEATFY